jgi:phage-related protein
MPSIGDGCHELRVPDGGRSWRIIYSLEPDAIVILDVFAKKTTRTPARIVGACRSRLRAYRELMG